MLLAARSSRKSIPQKKQIYSFTDARQKIEREYRVPNLLGAGGRTSRCCGATVLDPGMLHTVKNGPLECGRLSSSAAAVAGIHDPGAGP